MTDKEKLTEVRGNIFGARTKMIEAQRDINILLDKKGADINVIFPLNKCFTEIQIAFEHMGIALMLSYEAEKNMGGEVAE